MRATARGIMGSVFFAFDLDGTLTLDESFPLLGRELDADGSEEMRASPPPRWTEAWDWRTRFAVV